MTTIGTFGTSCEEVLAGARPIFEATLASLSKMRAEAVSLDRARDERLCDALDRLADVVVLVAEGTR